MLALDDTTLPWIEVAPGVPYFRTDEGQPWLPVGHNDSITWVSLAGVIRQRNLPAVDQYLAMLARHGVNVLRLMLEYCQREGTYFERPIGRYQPHMVQLWDDLLALCAKHG